MPVSLAVIILTRDEAVHIGRALASVSGIARSLHVIDSGSSDGTLAIARSLGAEVLHREWKHHADQFQWALGAIDSDAEWILRLDADEYIEPDLAAKILAELPGLASDIGGVTLDRKQVFMGRWIRHGGRYPLRMVRLFRRGQGHVEQRWMDEHIVVDRGAIAHFDGGFVDDNLKGLGFFIDKHNGYACREAVDVLGARLGLFEAAGEALEAHAARRRALKTGLYQRLPFASAALGYFLLRYWAQLGFLDGREGLIYHGLQGFWYRFLVGARIVEFERAIAGLTDKAEIRRRLGEIAGLRLEEDQGADWSLRGRAPATRMARP